MQLVTLKWEDGNEERQLSLWDIQEDGSGRLKWQEVEQAFDASRVEIVRGEAASLCGEAPFQGFTEDLYRSGEHYFSPLSIVSFRVWDLTSRSHALAGRTFAEDCGSMGSSGWDTWPAELRGKDNVRTYSCQGCGLHDDRSCPG